MLVLATVVGSLAVGLTGFAITQSTDSPNDLTLAVAVCTGEQRSKGQLPSDAETVACTSEVMENAVREGRTSELFTIMERLQRDGNDLCHYAAHRSGAQLLGSADDWELYASRVDVNVCDSGLLHGVFDRFAQLRPTEEHWRAVAAWCTTQQLDPTSANCGDAVGHAAYDATGSREKAAAICALLVDVEVGRRGECTEGVVMQEFRPISKPDKWQIAVDKSVLIGVCGHLPDDGTTLHRGCAQGIGWVLAQELEYTLDAAGRLRDESNVVANVGELMDTCGRLGGPDEGFCVERLVDGILNLERAFSGPVELIVCPVRPAHKRLCTAAVDLRHNRDQTGS